MRKINYAVCLNCKKVTQEEKDLLIMNDLDANCISCGLHIVEWFMNDHTRVFTMENEEGDSCRVEVSA
jgi:hypothetical protein